MKQSRSQTQQNKGQDKQNKEQDAQSKGQNAQNKGQNAQHKGPAKQAKETAEEMTFDKAMTIALRYLENRDRTVLEMEKRLRDKDVEEALSKQVIERLLAIHYLDDAAYATAFLRHGLAKGRGRRRIGRELFEKGVSKDIFDAACCALEEEEGLDLEIIEEQAAMKEALRIIADKPIEEKLLAKVGRRLATLGYPTDMIYATLRKCRGGFDD